jgi:hypothetical protein
MVSARTTFSPKLLRGVTGAALVLVLAGCSTISGVLSAAIGAGASQSAESQQSKDAPASSKSSSTSSRSGKNAAYQYQFSTFYGSMWNMGWLGYKDSSYKVGQGTIWEFTSKGGRSGDPVTFERALLKINADSSQWWRFKLDTGKESTLYEFLVNAEAVVQKVRFKDPDTGTIEEFIPSASGPSMGEATTPKRQSDLAKYKVDRQTVRVRAGSFAADHYLYPDERGNGNTETWVSQSVPGSVLRSVYTQTKDKQTSTVELIKIETSVTTQLGSF